ncbi:hypothetical protein HDK90DRAFT_123246 [Phyllosticta capitalensis]|uniref:Secreted protein n=1 Tax=Phyllosticta capitalensis TaxID=121624 RepID=A0ABR1YXL6_9PEZI
MNVYFLFLSSALAPFERFFSCAWLARFMARLAGHTLLSRRLACVVAFSSSQRTARSQLMPRSGRWYIMAWRCASSSCNFLSSAQLSLSIFITKCHLCTAKRLSFSTQLLWLFSRATDVMADLIAAHNPRKTSSETTVLLCL